MAFPALSDPDYEAFWRDGYVIKRRFFDAEEIDLLNRAIGLDDAIRKNIIMVNDSQGATTELAVWNHPGDDLFGAFARCERVVGGMRRLLGGEVYHYHSKLTMKRPGVGGAWNWQQDYGYWYEIGCLFPDLVSIAIAVDKATRENGCIEFLRGSHKLGRIDHGSVGGQTGADVERVSAIERQLDRVHLETEPGDACFFHCNTLHSSAQNKSDKNRNILICCYNKATNNPVKEHHHPGYTPLAVVPDGRIKALGLTLDGDARAFLDPDRDKTNDGTRRAKA